MIKNALEHSNSQIVAEFHLGASEVARNSNFQIVEADPLPRPLEVEEDIRKVQDLNHC